MNRPALVALALSFVIYALPVFNIHAGFVPWPLMYFGDLGDGITFALAGLIGALILQALAWLVFYGLLRRFRWWKAIIIAGALPVLFYAVNFTFMYAVPAVVLIAPDWSKDVGELERVCFAADVTPMQVNTGVSLTTERNEIAWVRYNERAGAGILRLPECSTDHIADFAQGNYRSVNAAGEVLFQTYAAGHRYAKAGMADTITPPAPSGIRHWNPLLTTTGNRLAWLDRGPEGPDGKPHVIHLRDVGGNDNGKTITLDLPPRTGLSLLEAAPPHFTLAQHRNKILVVDEAGKVVWGPVSPEGIYNAEHGFRRVGENGWVAWDGYRESGQSRLAWSLASGNGEVVMPRGRTIESAAVSADGQLIAFATEANSYFNAEGRLVILRTDDGGIVYRRRLPQFARLQLAFLGNDHIAFRNYQDGPKGTGVYRIGEP